MAKSQYITVRGTASWAKVFEQNRDMYEFNEETGAFDLPSSTDGVYSIKVHLDMDEYKKLKRSGSMSCKFSKEDETGLEVVTFKRKHVHKGQGGKVLDFASGSPTVVDDMDQKWDLEKNGMIGNESDVEVTVVVYETRFNPGTRLEKVKVLNHVPVESKEKDNEEIPF